MDEKEKLIRIIKIGNCTGILCSTSNDLDGKIINCPLFVNSLCLGESYNPDLDPLNRGEYLKNNRVLYAKRLFIELFGEEDLFKELL